MRRLAIGNVILAVALTFIILLSSINIEGAMILPPQTANIMTSVPAYHFTVTGISASITAGQSFSGVIVTVYNSKDAVATGYKGSVYFTSTDPKATLPYTSECTYTFTTGSKGDKGVHTFSGFNLVTAGSQTITVTGTSATSESSNSISVNDASPVSMAISPATATITAGLTETYSATAKDYYGNSWVVTSLVSWSITSGAGCEWNLNTYTWRKWNLDRNRQLLRFYCHIRLNGQSCKC